MSDTEDSEQVEIEIRIYRRKTRRKRYRSTCQCYACTRTVTAPCPAKLIRKSRLGTSLWAHVLLDKFASHRPTARLLEELKQHGLDLATGTVADGLRRLEPMFVPVYEALLKRNQASSLCQADETRWLVFVDQEGKIGHRWWLWVFLGEDTVVYRLDPTRSHDVPEQHFAADAACVLMVDRYSAYKAMPQVKSGTIKLAFCWSHVRRDFIEVGKGWPELTDWALTVASSHPPALSLQPPTIETSGRLVRVSPIRRRFARSDGGDAIAGRRRTDRRKSSRPRAARCLKACRSIGPA